MWSDYFSILPVSFLLFALVLLRFYQKKRDGKIIIQNLVWFLAYNVFFVASLAFNSGNGKAILWLIGIAIALCIHSFIIFLLLFLGVLNKPKT